MREDRASWIRESLIVLAASAALGTALAACSADQTPKPAATGGATRTNCNGYKVIYGYARLDEMKYHDNKNGEADRADQSYKNVISSWASIYATYHPEYCWIESNFLSDRRSAVPQNDNHYGDHGFHSRKNLENLLNKINYDTDANAQPNVPVDEKFEGAKLNPGDMIIVVRDSHISAEAPISARYIHKIRVRQADLVVLDRNVNTKDASDPTPLWKYYEDKTATKVLPWPSIRSIGPLEDGGGDGGGNGG
jgi:hypothetical protein